MQNVSLLFGIHMHQPVDNFSEAVEEAVERCYGPFFETMIKFSEFKFSLHCSGWLLDYIRQKHPKVFKDMLYLTKKGSIEWIGAGYYEPVLSAIPSKDRKAQINKLNDYIYKHFGVTPKGLWLTERVWESALIPDLAESKMEFTIVDDYHFLSSGFEESSLDGYFTTEEGGIGLKLFPISKPLRYALPFFSVENAIKTILDSAKNENSAAVIFDDAEKFGLWPKTNEWVYGKKWLERFVKAVLEDESIETKHYSEYIHNNRSRGNAYLNNTSYFEMGEWSLHPEQSLALEELKQNVGDDFFHSVGIAFIKGGIWKNFFVKYHESNYIHKRMLSMSKYQKEFDKDMLDSLYKLQTNDVFWHGVFGGLYLPNLRDNAYCYLLEIEKKCSLKDIAIDAYDIDKDAYEELKVLTPKLSMVFSSKWGAQLIELGSLDVLFNWQNTLMRRREAYHEKILNPQFEDEKIELAEDEEEQIETIHNTADAIDESLKDELIYDWHPKHSFIDHFSPESFKLESFKKVSFQEVGDFANQPFELDGKNSSFVREGGIYHNGEHKANLIKRYRFEDDRLCQTLLFESEYVHHLYYGVEFNFHFAHPHKVTLNGSYVEDGISFEDVRKLEIIDSFTNKRIILEWNKGCKIDAYILNTISQSESGFDRVAQQISILGSFEISSKFDLKTKLGVKDV